MNKSLKVKILGLNIEKETTLQHHYRKLNCCCCSDHIIGIPLNVFLTGPLYEKKTKVLKTVIFMQGMKRRKFRLISCLQYYEKVGKKKKVQK